MIPSIDTFSNAAIGTESQVLQDIHLASKSIAIYQRDTESLSGDLAQISEQEIQCKVSGSVEEIVSQLHQYFDTQLPPYPRLLADIAELLTQFEAVSKSSVFRLLLSTISTNMCRKFHTDVNDLRMLCSYVGPGTLWLPEEAIELNAKKAKASNQEIVIDDRFIQQAGTGDVVILKGALYPEGNPILHRSPTIEAAGETRLLLRIDTQTFRAF